MQEEQFNTNTKEMFGQRKLKNSVRRVNGS